MKVNFTLHNVCSHLNLNCFKPGLHNSESSKGQIDQHAFAAGHKILFHCSLEEILKRQTIIRSCKPQNGESKSVTVYSPGKLVSRLMLKNAKLICLWHELWSKYFLHFVSSSSSFEPVVTIHCLATLDLEAGVVQPFNCLIIQKHQVVQSMEKSMDWTLKDDKVDSLFFCATLTCCKGSYPICASRSGNVWHGAETVKPDHPRYSWQGHSRRSGVGDESTESCGVVQPLHIPLVIRQSPALLLLLSVELMNCCAAGTNGCLDLRCRAFPLGGQVSAK